jgi:hypothetical protein
MDPVLQWVVAVAAISLCFLGVIKGRRVALKVFGLIWLEIGPRPTEPPSR